jgi:dolichyl-diphosphooligosaccharide--protein glycosyltransferase
VAKPTKQGKKSGKKASGITKSEPAPVNATEPALVDTSAQQRSVQVEASEAQEAESPVIRFLKSSFSIYTVAIAAVMAVMLYIRIAIPYNTVFTNWPGNYINIAADDAPEQMRMVLNTLAHFPIRELYDPFTNYPYGSLVHFGPLFTMLIAVPALILGLGHPSTQLTITVGAYVPAVLGALCAIPTYYVGKKLFGRNAGLLAALILMFLPGQFLERSLLGFTDHHVAEVLFSVATIAVLVYALDSAKKTGISLEHIKNRDFKPIKETLVLSFLAGVTMGCYLLSWPGGLLVAFMLFIYFVLQCIIDHIRGKSLDSTLIIAGFMYFIPMIMVLPYSLQYLHFDLVNWSLTQPVVLGTALIGIGLIYAISRLMEKRAPRLAYPVALAIIAIVGMVFLSVAIPPLYAIIMAGLGKFQASGGMLTVAEAQPPGFSALWMDFNWNLIISIGAMFLLVYRIYRDRRPAELMFLVWNLIMLWAAYTEIRFTYYFAVNASLLTAYVAMEAFNLLGAQKFRENFVKRVKSVGDLPGFIGKFSMPTAAMALLAAVFIVIAVWPVTSLGQNITWQEAQGGPGGMMYQWYDALYWMGNHTPDPQGSTISQNFDYANGTYAIPANYGVDSYDYPSSAYSVMSWWDYGNDIEYVAHRIPDANPFQDGITAMNGTTGAAPFFTSTNETQSVQMLDELNSRYVIIDNEMATDGWQSGKFGAIQVWVNDTTGWATQSQAPYIWIDSQSGNAYSSNTNEIPIVVDTDKWNDSIMNRLYFQDCDGMSHYRLVYESAGSYTVDARAGQVTQGSDGSQYVQMVYGGGTMPVFQADNYTQAEQIYDLYSNNVISNSQTLSQYIYGARQPEKWVKIYEKVDGATITGSAPDGSSVTASLNLTTNDGRPFTYTQTVTAVNGTYSMVVPYPSQPMQGPGYSYNITSDPQYNITYGNTTQTVVVPEGAVMNGGTIQVT